MPAASRTSRRTARRVAAAVRWYRRPVAAACLVLALVSVLHGARPEPGPAAEVLVAARPLEAGHRLTDGDLVLRRVDADAVPDAALRSTPTGRVVALPVTRGEVVTEVRLVGAGLLDALDPGTVAVPVHLSDASTARIARVGDVVDVLGAGEDGFTTIAARAALVLVAPPAASPSLLRGGTDDAIVVLAVDRGSAVSLARAAATSRLSLVLRSGREPEPPAVR